MRLPYTWMTRGANVPTRPPTTTSTMVFREIISWEVVKSALREEPTRPAIRQQIVCDKGMSGMAASLRQYPLTSANLPSNSVRPGHSDLIFPGSVQCLCGRLVPGHELDIGQHLRGREQS